MALTVAWPGRTGGFEILHGLCPNSEAENTVVGLSHTGFADGCGCKIICIGAYLAVGFFVGLNIGHGFSLEKVKNGCNGDRRCGGISRITHPCPKQTTTLRWVAVCDGAY